MRSRKNSFTLVFHFYLFAFLLTMNLVYSRSYPWILFCLPPLAFLPAAILLKQRLDGLRFARIAVAAAALFYVLLNILLPGRFFWAFIPAAALLWYPCALQFHRSARRMSLFGFVWSVLFFGGLNLLTTPQEIWAVYPIFGAFWWPLSVYFFGREHQQDAAEEE